MRLGRFPPVGPARGVGRVLLRGRWVILAAELATLLLHAGSIPVGLLTGLVLLVVVYNLAPVAVARSAVRSQMPPLVLVASDLVVVTLLAHSTDGFDSLFLALYYLVIVAATLLYHLPGALFAVAGAGVAALALRLLGSAPALDGGILVDWAGLAIVGASTAVLDGLLQSEARLRAAAERSAQRLAYEQEATRRDMQRAREVQRAMLPPAVPVVHGWEIGVSFRPAGEVGGDYYFFATAENRLAILIADAAGHNVPAALVVAGMAQRAPEAAVSGDTAAMFTRWNRSLSASTPAEMFVTAACCVLDTETGEGHYVNAGHPPALCYAADAGGELLFGPTGPALGRLPGGRDTEHPRWRHPGDTLVLCTDGALDAVSHLGERLGSENLARLVRGILGRPAAAAASLLMADVCALYSVADDITFIVVRRAPVGTGEAPAPARA